MQFKSEITKMQKIKIGRIIAKMFLHNLAILGIFLIFAWSLSNKNAKIFLNGIQTKIAIKSTSQTLLNKNVNCEKSIFPLPNMQNK